MQESIQHYRRRAKGRRGWELPEEFTQPAACSWVRRTPREDAVKQLRTKSLVGVTVFTSAPEEEQERDYSWENEPGVCRIRNRSVGEAEEVVMQHAVRGSDAHSTTPMLKGWAPCSAQH